MPISGPLGLKHQREIAKDGAGICIWEVDNGDALAAGLRDRAGCPNLASRWSFAGLMNARPVGLPAHCLRR